MNWRYRLLIILFAFLFGLIVLRLFYWQVVKAADLAKLGKMQYGKKLVIPAKRGEIKTSDNFSIATNKITYTVFANPKQIKDKETAATLLSSVLETDKASVSANLSLDLFWVPIKKGIDISKKSEVEKLNLSGVGFEQEYTRFYPEASMSAHILGFLGKNDSGEDKGYFGLEGYYDRLLRGKDGEAMQILDAFGKPVLASISQLSGQIDGSSIVLSIDRSVQYLVESELEEGVERYGATSGMIGVMDPKTGEIIALASFPKFDPKNFWEYSEKLYKNPFITDLYEPGSTFKPLVMSAAINSNLVTPDTKCTACAGPVSIGGYDIHTWNDKYQANISMTDVIVHSDNTGMVFVSQKLGLDRMLDYFTKFGIGSLTGIDLQGEITSQIKPKENWYVVDLATASFGQGISVTPIQLLSAISAIANEGKRMEPHIVKAIESPDGKVTKVNPKLINTPIDAKTAKVMTEIMIKAVNKGEANYASLKNYRIAGKTGTASIPIKGHYDPNKTIASFVGFAPADDPKFVMLVVLDRPTTSIYGADTAAPIFFSIAKDLLLYYGISPSR
jgi:stage V sporulation protein D (sporulation-specific penicillin-binding protein)